MLAASRDVCAILLLYLSIEYSRQKFVMRGVTYRPTVVPAHKERIWKALFYLGLIGSAGTALRRAGQALSLLGVPVFPRSAAAARFLRAACLYLPAALWALRGPLSERGSTRDDRGFSEAALRSPIWRWVRDLGFRKQAWFVLSEEWRGLSAEERARWQEETFLVGMHPHGLLPVGAIINGLTWASGGLRGITASGATLPEPPHAGSGLHQRWFPNWHVRAAVASGAAGLFPVFYEMFSKLGAFDCSKPFMRAQLRAGKVVAVFPGGAAESAYARPGRYVCWTKHKGFARLALEERKHLLPIWTFGDESLMPLHDPSTAALPFRLVQRFLSEALGLKVPIRASGLPRFPPVTTVCGTPIPLDDLWPEACGQDVSDEAVDEALRRYLAAQKKLFDSNKALVAGGHGDAEIEFM